MPEEYHKPSVGRIGFDYDAARLAQSDGCLRLTHKDVLGIVQSALDELGPQSPELIAIKREVLDEVADGKLAHAIRTAILGWESWVRWIAPRQDSQHLSLRSWDHQEIWQIPIE